MPYSKTEFEAIRKAVSETEIPRVSLVNKTGEENYYVFSLLPEDAQVIILNMPDDPRGIQSYRRVLLDELQVSFSHPVFEIMEHILRHKRDDTPQEYLAKKIQQYFENRLEHEKIDIQKKYDYIFRLERARTYVRRITSVELPLIREGRKTYIQVGRDKFPAKEKEIIG